MHYYFDDRWFQVERRGKICPTYGMVKPTQTAFVAFPSEDHDVKEALNAAAELSTDEKLQLIPWPKLAIYGLKIDDLIRDKITQCDVLIADITYPNFNVYYEIGFAMAKEKPVLPTMYLGAKDGEANARRTGLFDGIGWLKYQNSTEFTALLADWEMKATVERYDRQKDHAKPLFILDLSIKSNFRQYIFEGIANKSTNYRVFDPFETASRNSAQIIADITASSGCIIPLLQDKDQDFIVSNLRAAFIAGVCHGLEMEALLIQSHDGPAPLDYRDYITNTKSRAETHSHVEDYCAKVLIRNQTASNRAERLQLGLLTKINIGQASAENEGDSLLSYFVETAEYKRAEKSDHALIVGRKGSGKTAIYYKLRQKYRRQRDSLIVELRPATHNLSELRHHLSSVAHQGLFDHTISAFWQYMLYLEILLKIREEVLPKSKRDFELQKRISEIEVQFDMTGEMVSGDFTARLATAVEAIIDALRGIERNQTISIEEYTNLFYETKVPEIRDAIISFSEFFQDIIVLIDDLDKGWPPQRLENQDVMMIRHLVESLRKMERELRRSQQPFKSYLFLRSDVYENLVDVTSDRNKQVIINVDWSDPHQLSDLLKRRVIASFSEEERNDAWEAVNPVMSDGSYAFDQMIAGALFRPRFLIDLCEKILSIAINREAAYVDEKDVEKGLIQLSRYLVSDFGYEVRDISGVSEKLFYAFVGNSNLLTRDEIQSAIVKFGIDYDVDELILLLLWYGFLGVARNDKRQIFIFDRGYDFQRLLTDQVNAGPDILYSVNPAFLRGLDDH